MVSRFYKSNLLSIYFLLWMVVATIHFFILYLVYHFGFFTAFIDSIIFNAWFCLLGIGLWFYIEYYGIQDRTRTDTMIQHITMSAAVVALWIGLGNVIIRQINSDDHVYLVFLKQTLIIRVFLGYMYYGLLVSFCYLLMSFRQLREKRKEK